MKLSAARWAKVAVVCLATAGLSGCIGVYNNSKQFLNNPENGMAEGDLIRQYGTPAYSGFVENEKLYTYKVRDNKYMVLVGVYEGYDLVVTCRNGVVTNTRRVERPQAFSLLYPTPWAEAE